MLSLAGNINRVLTYDSSSTCRIPSLFMHSLISLIDQVVARHRQLFHHPIYHSLTLFLIQPENLLWRELTVGI